LSNKQALQKGAPKRVPSGDGLVQELIPLPANKSHQSKRSVRNSDSSSSSSSSSGSESETESGSSSSENEANGSRNKNNTILQAGLTSSSTTSNKTISSIQTPSKPPSSFTALPPSALTSSTPTAHEKKKTPTAPQNKEDRVVFGVETSTSLISMVDSIFLTTPSPPILPAAPTTKKEVVLQNEDSWTRLKEDNEDVTKKSVTTNSNGTTDELWSEFKSRDVQNKQREKELQEKEEKQRKEREEKEEERKREEDRKRKEFEEQEAKKREEEAQAEQIAQTQREAQRLAAKLKREQSSSKQINMTEQSEIMAHFEAGKGLIDSLQPPTSSLTDNSTDNSNSAK